MNFKKYADSYRDALLNDVVPFWEKNSPDWEFGGYFTCLDREGKVYDKDKFIWLQCRQVWLFSMLYNNVEQKKEWLDIALLGADFLKKYGMDKEGNWYFSLTREGKPLVQPYNIFSDCFAVMAFAQLGKATGKEEYDNIARDTFRNILERRDHPKGIYDKTFQGTRPMKNFALPMILSNLVLEVEHLIEPELVGKTIDYAVHEVMEVFYRKEHGFILENVASDGGFIDTFDGRLVCPGHGLESMWFVMDIGVRNKDNDLIHKAKDIALELLEYGWDKDYKGIFYFKDAKGYPLDRLDGNQKLWWVHQEAMLAMLKGYALTGDEKCWKWFEKVHDYAWNHFSDKENGEWFGYLDQKGEVLLSLKGGKWKGCFHTPRFLYQGWKTLESTNKNNV
ncbi:AGE family epimerase/isomerase [Kriegella aquimaris]|uniref:N-acylglucosamine 2-epimerase n=1 Tax=Kriegella aquimaris TaxID=192904 RepID=A0A1G9YHH3_9FLAO|nr:AGE family epimerase/isomerase [Kriegella aquimaris]SDN08537.1 N-acylglucosamine 2-epimerase [Kriegella aquimaris]